MQARRSSAAAVYRLAVPLRSTGSSGLPPCRTSHEPWPRCGSSQLLCGDADVSHCSRTTRSPTRRRVSCGRSSGATSSRGQAMATRPGGGGPGHANTCARSRSTIPPSDGSSRRGMSEVAGPGEAPRRRGSVGACGLLGGLHQVAPPLLCARNSRSRRFNLGGVAAASAFESRLLRAADVGPSPSA